MQEDSLAAVVCSAQASLVGKASVMVSLAMAYSAMASLAMEVLERMVCLARGCLEKEVS